MRVSLDGFNTGFLLLNKRMDLQTSVSSVNRYLIIIIWRVCVNAPALMR